MASGTFTGTGQSAAVAGRSISILMDFAGTASVDVEVQKPSGTWMKIETGITADYFKVLDAPGVMAVRLNCTAYTNDVYYSLGTGGAG